MGEHGAAYLIAVLLKHVKLLLAEVAHRDAFDLVRHVSVHAGTGGTHEDAEVHDRVSGALRHESKCQVPSRDSRSTCDSPAGSLGRLSLEFAPS